MSRKIFATRQPTVRFWLTLLFLYAKIISARSDAMSFKCQKLVLSAFFTALIVCGAYIKIPIPFIPITLQTAFVILSGLLLGAKYSAASNIAYLLLGLSGFPVFSGGGGLSYVLQPTFGYIIGFILGALVTGLISRKLIKKNTLTYFISGLIGLVVIYICGISYYCFISHIYLHINITFRHIFIYGFISTAPCDILFTALAAYTAKRLSPVIKYD